MSNRSEQALNVIEPLISDLSYDEKAILLELIFQSLDVRQAESEAVSAARSVAEQHDKYAKQRVVRQLISEYYIRVSGTRTIIDGDEELEFIPKSEYRPCGNCYEEFIAFPAEDGGDLCEYCDDESSAEEVTTWPRSYFSDPS